MNLPREPSEGARPLRILMVHNEYARPSGEEAAVKTLAGLLTGHGHHVRQFTKCSADVSNSLAGRAGAFFSGVYSRRSRLELARILDEDGPWDVVQIQNVYPQISPSVFPLCRQRGIPIVMRCPNYRLFCPTGLHYTAGRICERCVGGREWECLRHNCAGDRIKSAGYALRGAFARATRLITDNTSVFLVLSEFQRSKFIANGIPADRVTIVPNCDSADSIPQGDYAPGETVAFVGRPSEEKGIRTFLAAARQLPEIPFAIAGEVPEGADWAADPPPNVRMHGFLTGAALDQFYLNTRIFIHPGVWYEGFPNVITRAMVFARPVIASNLGAIPEIVTDRETGLLFPPGDANQLAATIRSLYGDLERCRQLGEGGQAKARRAYHPDVVYARLMDLYAGIMHPDARTSAPARSSSR